MIETQCHQLGGSTMHQTIPITEALRDYIERLHYESVRYKDLLATIHRECCPMTDEEWDSSWPTTKRSVRMHNLACAAQWKLYMRCTGTKLERISTISIFPSVPSWSVILLRNPLMQMPKVLQIRWIACIRGPSRACSYQRYACKGYYPSGNRCVQHGLHILLPAPEGPS